MSGLTWAASRAWFCDECESPLTGADLSHDGSPAIVTDGDHQWCGACWREHRERIEAERAEDGEEGGARD